MTYIFGVQFLGTLVENLNPNVTGSAAPQHKLISIDGIWQFIESVIDCIKLVMPHPVQTNWVSPPKKLKAAQIPQ